LFFKTGLPGNHFEMVDEQYVSDLVFWGKLSAANFEDIKKRTCELRQLIGIHGGGQLVSVAAPGQHIAYSRPVTLQEEFGAHARAWAQIEGRPYIIRTAQSVFW
jgi:hypothetical protein